MTVATTPADAVPLDAERGHDGASGDDGVQVADRDLEGASLTDRDLEGASLPDLDVDGARATARDLDAGSGVRRWAILVLTAPIVAYRRISPAFPATCRFHPSCSAYALAALHTHGPLVGLGLTVWRLLRCQPFHPGGYDPVPLPRHRSRRSRNRRSSGASRWTTSI